jgi:hypothetical protein
VFLHAAKGTEYKVFQPAEATVNEWTSSLPCLRRSMANEPDPELMVQFCREIIPAILTKEGVGTPEAVLAGKDILSRAEAVARLDRESYEILAAPFYEESFDHEPADAPEWLKALTTLVVRNSQLEELHANGPVTNAGVKVITDYGLPPLSHLMSARRRLSLLQDVADDPFVGLSAAYPRAWSCLSALRVALLGDGGRVGYRLPDGPPPDLPDPAEVIESQPAEKIDVSSGASFTSEVLSGIDSRFGQDLVQIMEAASEEMLLNVSALSRFSRNSRKLLRVLDFQLAHKSRVLTTNYLLTCKEVWVRRGRLVKPDSRRPVDGLRDSRGLSGAHRKTVEEYLRKISQAEQ